MKWGAIIIAIVVAGLMSVQAAFAGITERVSVDSYGNEGNGRSTFQVMSPDGRYVAFLAMASNLVSNDLNGTWDVFLHDRQTGITERINVDSNGNEANGPSSPSVNFAPTISSDVRYVAFVSDASNLVSGDTNGYRDVFVKDRLTGITERVSVSSTGIEGNGPSYYPAISPDGRYVAFVSDAKNFILGNWVWVYPPYNQLFIHDRYTRTTKAVVDPNEVCPNNRFYYRNQMKAYSYPTFSADGRYLFFGHNCDAPIWHNAGCCLTPYSGPNLILSVDMITGTFEDVWSNNQTSLPFSISADNRYVAFASTALGLVPNDTNKYRDIFVRDRQTGLIERVNVDSNGNEANYNSFSDSLNPSISADGRYVAFQSGATNLVPNDSNSRNDVFLHDRQTGSTERVSIDSFGNEGNHHSLLPSLGADGRIIAFFSYATNLVPNDTNGVGDIFIHMRGATLESMLTDIEQLYTSGEISSGGITESLMATLENALDAKERGDITAAQNMLEAFINKVEAQAGKQITQETAEKLINDAISIIENM